MMLNPGMKIGAVAEQTGFTTQAIRFYEHEGLLPKPERTHTSYRMYGPEIVSRLNFIKRARSLGLSLDEIKEIFSMTRVGRAPCCRVRELLHGKLRELEQKIAALSQFRNDLDRFLRTLAKIPDQTDASRQVCALVELAPLEPKGSRGQPVQPRERKK